MAILKTKQHPFCRCHFSWREYLTKLNVNLHQ